MNDMSVKEISEILGLQPSTVKKRLQKRGIKPLRYVGQAALYAPDVIDLIRYIKMGRPKKPKPDPPP
jgi:predicted ArsR family transcriptional regulator